jgi:hypothetical protein
MAMTYENTCYTRTCGTREPRDWNCIARGCVPRHTGFGTMHHQVTMQTFDIVAWLGSTPSTPTLIVTSGVSSASGSTQAGIPCEEVVPLPSYAPVADASCARNNEASCTCGICTTSTCRADSPSTSGSWCTSVGHKELGGTVVRSPMLVADGTTRDGCGGVTGCATD